MALGNVIPDKTLLRNVLQRLARLAPALPVILLPRFVAAM